MSSGVPGIVTGIGLENVCLRIKTWFVTSRNQLSKTLASDWEKYSCLVSVQLLESNGSSVVCCVVSFEWRRRGFFFHLNFRHYWPLSCSLHMNQTPIKQIGVLGPLQNLPFGSLQLIQCCICSRHRGIPNVQYFNHDRCCYNMSACSGDVLVRIKTWQFLMSFD